MSQKSILNRLCQIRQRIRPRRTLPAYTSFVHASANTRGYEDAEVVRVVSRKTEILRENLTSSQVRTVADSQTAQNMFVLTYAWSGQPLNVLDIGGGCGQSFFVLDHLLPRKIESWLVVETATMAAEGQRLFKSERLSFFDNVSEAISTNRTCDLLIASGVLQYLPDAPQAVETWCKVGAGFIYLTRTVIALGLRAPVFTRQETELRHHGPGPLPEGFVNRQTSQPLTIVPYETVISRLSEDYATDFVFQESEDETVRIGLRKVTVCTMGFLFRRCLAL